MPVGDRPLRRLDAIQQKMRRRPPPDLGSYPEPVADAVPVDEILRAHGVDAVDSSLPKIPIEPAVVEPYRMKLAISADVSPEAVVDVKAAMALLGLSRKQVQNLAASGRLVGDKDGSGRWRLTLASVIRLVNTRAAAAALAADRQRDHQHRAHSKPHPR